MRKGYPSSVRWFPEKTIRTAVLFPILSVMCIFKFDKTVKADEVANSKKEKNKKWYKIKHTIPIKSIMKESSISDVSHQEKLLVPLSSIQIPARCRASFAPRLLRVFAPIDEIGKIE